jgi:hypothetical protein
MSNTPSDFDVANPWDAVWNRVLEMKDWWMDEFERPAGLIVSKVMSLNAALGGDVQIASMHQQYQPPAQLQHQLNMPQKTGRGKGGGQHKNPGKRQRVTKNGQTPPPQQAISPGHNGSPASSSLLSCKICRATDHDYLNCTRYDPHYRSSSSKGGKVAKGGKKGGK